jgi:hypothetical protein
MTIPLGHHMGEGFGAVFAARSYPQGGIDNWYMSRFFRIKGHYTGTNIQLEQNVDSGHWLYLSHLERVWSGQEPYPATPSPSLTEGTSASESG